MINKRDTGWHCKVLASTKSPLYDSVITTLELRFPRFILPQFNTHRVISKNAASSRAIPTSKIIERVRRDPYIPTFTANKKGMSGEVLSKDEQESISHEIVKRANETCDWVEFMLSKKKIHKQDINRYLEPFMWVDVVCTATRWTNMFSQRIAHDAQPAFQKLAIMMFLAINDADIKTSNYHLPYILPEELNKYDYNNLAKISSARCARVSYTNHGTNKIDVDADFQLCNDLIKDTHWSPLEHPCEEHDASSANYDNWKSYRKIFNNENQSFFFVCEDTIEEWRKELKNG